jgi:hypothetical protein
MKLKFSDRFLKKAEISSFIKIRPVGAEFSHADGWIDGYDKANSHFLQYS